MGAGGLDMAKKLTINDIARLANTSKTTVSFYLNGRFENMSQETRLRIQKVIEETNYAPNIAARFLSNSKTNLVGILVGDITNSFSNQLVKGIEACANERNYQIIMSSSNYDFEMERRHVERLLQIGVDGFIVQPTRNFSRLVKLIQESGKEIVFIDSNLQDDTVASVKSDNYTSVYNCIDRIIESNQYDEYIMIGADATKLSTRQERSKGFIDAVSKHNKMYQNIIVSNNASEAEVSTKLIEHIKLGVRSVIFVPNCWLLPTVYLVLSKYRALIPQTIGLVGLDNTEWTGFVSPTVTTIVQPAYEEGHLVMSKLADLIEKKENVNIKEVMLCQVNWKESINI